MSNAPSWGRLKQRSRASAVFDPTKQIGAKASILPYGNGRSYGDSCHNDTGTLMTIRHQCSVQSFDPETGILIAESGILLRDILQHIQGTGWFLPVVPGTKFVTLGGAIANDIHGKNHEKRGTFGQHVKSFALWRSSGDVLTCNAQQNANLFNATIGGMGLTGILLSAELQLMKVASHYVEERKTPFANLDGYFDLEDDRSGKDEYSVAWVDSLARGKTLGRGISITGNHVAHKATADYADPRWSVPVTPPVPLVSGLPLRLFNSAYFHRKRQDTAARIASPDSFFFPLDAITGWNRLYGPKGLFQHQCVIPLAAAREIIPTLLRTSHVFDQGSFLTVLKRFGAHCSPGFMSFPGPGYTLTLDFANRGAATRQLLDRLDAITLDAGGRANPYKDGRMGAATYQRFYPQWQQLEELRDPAIQSDFWRRVSQPVSRHLSQVAAPPLSTLTPTGMQMPVNHTTQQDVQKTTLQSARDKRPADKAATGTR